MLNQVAKALKTVVRCNSLGHLLLTHIHLLLVILVFCFEFSSRNFAARDDSARSVEVLWHVKEWPEVLLELLDFLDVL
jgi:hypothetical protein